MRSLQTLLIGSGILIGCLSGCKDSSTELTGFVEGEFTYLTSSVPGTLKWLGVRRGEHVVQNQLLYRLDSEPEASELLAAKQRALEAEGKSKDIAAPARETQLGVIEGQLKEAQAQSDLFEVRLGRIRTLYNKKVLQRDALDASVADFERAKAQVQSLQSQLNEAKLGGRENAVEAAVANVAATQASVQRAQWNLEQKTGVAVGAGTVFDTFYQIGEFVPAGRPVLSLLLPKDIHIVFYLSSDRMRAVRLGSQIQLECVDCQKPLNASIDYISPVAEFTPPVIYSLENRPKLAFRILAHPDETQGLHPGQPVTIRINQS